jgi:hypothetical protein
VARQDFFIPFDEDNRLRVRIVTEPGRDVVEFMVQYEAFIDDRFTPVVRYDTAHGDARRDLLDAGGRTIDKQWLPGWRIADALQYAVSDLRGNWQRYREDFIRRMP